jgi:hypothetical protein
MADQMREMAFAGQTVSPETLAERGWSAASIKRLAPDAIARARRQSVRRLS